ncbi:hypothetical protein BLNAU_13089 [Blattamonas nauphoetae]|uniref:Uncharacterized protein n=1 Tax=Blattamonas nauphoetae TaxID=2049346 RepID=A0ABQ9XKJ0_9EUKA|nr:hypothetical protein BLNAU_13089 [Blattamonas nauphoetae]
MDESKGGGGRRRDSCSPGEHRQDRPQFPSQLLSKHGSAIGPTPLVEIESSIAIVSSIVAVTGIVHSTVDPDTERDTGTSSCSDSGDDGIDKQAAHVDPSNSAEGSNRQQKCGSRTQTTTETVSQGSGGGTNPENQARFC